MTRSDNPRISLLLISHSYPPIVGGSELEAQRVSAALRNRGHRVRVVCAGGDPMPRQRDWQDSYGTPVRIIGNRIASAQWRARVFAAGVVWSLIRNRREARTAYFLMQGLQVLVGVPVARLLGMRVVMKFSGSGEISRLKETWLGRIELLCLRNLAHSVMVLNEGMMKEAADAGFDASCLVWMPNPVDTEQFAPCSNDERLMLRQEAGLPQTAPIIVFVGRLAPPKALSTLVESFRLVLEEHNDAVLLLVGDGPSRAELEVQVAALRIGKSVRFAGMVDSTDVPRWLKLSDIFALISPLEGLSCALLEAMSTGLPAVVNDIPANTQLIEDGTHGIVAPLEDVDAIAAALLKLLSDPQLRSRLGAAARRRVVAEYSTGRIADRYEVILQSLCKARRIRAPRSR